MLQRVSVNTEERLKPTNKHVRRRDCMQTNKRHTEDTHVSGVAQ